MGRPGQPGDAVAVAELKARNAELEARIARLEQLLASVSLVQGGQTVRFTGVNVQIVSGSGATQADPPNGLGNLIVGYNELRGEDCDATESPSCEYPQTSCPPGDYNYCNCLNSRWGSHNVVVGSGNNYSSSGGLVVGRFNASDARYGSVAGGDCNSANEAFATVAGGRGNRAMGEAAVVLGGTRNVAAGAMSSVIGGDITWAEGYRSIAGGVGNRARGDGSAAVGGIGNEAKGQFSSVSGGSERVAQGESDWVAGSLLEDQ